MSPVEQRYGLTSNHTNSSSAVGQAVSRDRNLRPVLGAPTFKHLLICLQQGGDMDRGDTWRRSSPRC